MKVVTVKTETGRIGLYEVPNNEILFAGCGLLVVCDSDPNTKLRGNAMCDSFLLPDGVAGACIVNAYAEHGKCVGSYTERWFDGEQCEVKREI